jgi:hypothetical protein
MFPFAPLRLAKPAFDCLPAETQGAAESKVWDLTGAGERVDTIRP